ncbi:helix-turn-helix transcriptional regulator [Caenispirillum bisanense]|uniref:helix-turn-helix transcriptional regulator n=1 Tax=Caenispirillum bisanense TaxID=414052 RepID=UPI0039F6CB57
MYRLMRNGGFPQSRRYVGLSAAFYLSSEIEAWVEWQKQKSVAHAPAWTPPAHHSAHC